jgi:uncharacterized damage-inducible protein DinB
MTKYGLSVESGPQGKSTLVHVLDLLGCVVFARTTDEAVAAAPDEIRAYLRYLRRHGERSDQDAAITTEVVERITQGDFLGRGSSDIIFAAEREPLTKAQLAKYLRWLEWSRAELLALVERLDTKALARKPAQGRSLRDILLHVLGADMGYLYAALGAVKEVGQPVHAAERGELDLRFALRAEREVAIARLRGSTEAERVAPRGPRKDRTTFRRALRRMLEHEWEHRREIERRFEPAAVPDKRP